MKILSTCFSRSWGGLEMQALELSTRLRDRGHELWLACLPDSPLESEGIKRSLNVMPYDVTGYVHPRLVWRLGKFIARNDLDVIHCQLSRDIATIVPAVKVAMSDVPIVLTRGMGSYISKKDPFHQFTYGNVALVLAVSSVINRNVVETTPMAPESVITFPNGVDLNTFSPERIDRGESRRMLGIDDDTIVVGMIGRLSPGKGHNELLQAAAIVGKTHPEVLFLIVGEADKEEQEYAHHLHSLHESLGLRHSVRWVGFRTDIPQVLRAFDILAFPSHAEAFGVVLIEAMAMRLPVVSTNCDGVPDIVIDGETGITVEPKNATQLAHGLLRLIGDPQLRVNMGNAGRLQVERKFDQEQLIGRLEEIYRGLQRQA